VKITRPTVIEPGQAPPPGGEELRSTKNVQIIDAAANCTYHIYAFTDEQFALLFPEEGQDVEFIEDVAGRLSPEQQERAFSGAWTRPVRKPDAQGIHGTLFYQLDYKKEYYPSKRESDVAGPPHSPAVWLFEPEGGLSDTPGEDPGETGTPLPNWTSRSQAMPS
jgi:hypothetical protein